MAEINWSPEARKDFKAIYSTIARYNRPAALKIGEEIKAKIHLLSRHPLIGVKRPDLLPNLRMIASPPYLIFYEVPADSERAANGVLLLRIIDGRRDLKELL